MSVMFANARPAQQTSSGHLVEFKAGRFHHQPGSTPDKRKAVADKTKGLVFIKQTNDQLMHFCWKNRENGAVIEDLIIFPGDTDFVRVRECLDGRVFMLKFKTSEQRNLFWMQDGKTDKDEELCRKVNEVLNNPPTGGGLGASRASARGTAERAQQFSAAMGGLGGGAEELGALGSLDQQQLMQLLSLMNQGGGMQSLEHAASVIPQMAHARAARNVDDRGASIERSSTSGSRETPGGLLTGASSQSPLVQLSHLQEIISSLEGNSGAGRVPIEFADVVTGDSVGESVRRNSTRLTPHVPSEMASDSNEVLTTVRTPQFRQAAEIFGHALQSGQLAPVLPQLGVSEAASRAAASGDVLKFAESLTDAESSSQGSADKGGTGSQDTPDRKDDTGEMKEDSDGDEMDLD